MYGMNPVYVTAYVENLPPCLQLSIRDNSYLNIPNSNAILNFPINLAALRGHINIMTWIIECLVPIDVRNGLGRTVMDVAIERGTHELIKLLQISVAHVSGNALSKYSAHITTGLN